MMTINHIIDNSITLFSITPSSTNPIMIFYTTRDISSTLIRDVNNVQLSIILLQPTSAQSFPATPSSPSILTPFPYSPIPLPSTMYGGHIDELESFLHAYIQPRDECLLHQVLITTLLFVNDVILLLSTPEGLQRQLNALTIFCDLHQLTVNLGKTKVGIFNKSKYILSKHHFYFRGVEIDITTTYTYLGVQFSRPGFRLRKVIQP